MGSGRSRSRSLYAIQGSVSSIGSQSGGYYLGFEESRSFARTLEHLSKASGSPKNPNSKIAKELEKKGIKVDIYEGDVSSRYHFKMSDIFKRVQVKDFDSLQQHTYGFKGEKLYTRISNALKAYESGSPKAKQLTKRDIRLARYLMAKSKRLKGNVAEEIETLSSIRYFTKKMLDEDGSTSIKDHKSGSAYLGVNVALHTINTLLGKMQSHGHSPSLKEVNFNDSHGAVRYAGMYMSAGGYNSMDKHAFISLLPQGTKSIIPDNSGYTAIFCASGNAAHEFGHSVDKTFGISSKIKSKEAVSEYGSKSKEEAFAESFALYTHGLTPTKGKQYYAEFKSEMKKAGLSYLEGSLSPRGNKSDANDPATVKGRQAFLERYNQAKREEELRKNRSLSHRNNIFATGPSRNGRVVNQRTMNNRRRGNFVEKESTNGKAVPLDTRLKH